MKCKIGYENNDTSDLQTQFACLLSHVRITLTNEYSAFWFHKDHNQKKFSYIYVAEKKCLSKGHTCLVKEIKEIIVDAVPSFFASQLEQKIRSLKGFIYLTSPFSRHHFFAIAF